MYVDSLLQFIASPLSLVSGAGIAIPTAPFDLLGNGVGVAPNNIIGNATVFGTDFGVGQLDMEMMCRIGTALVTGTGATLNLAWQFAPDTGAAGGYQPGTWQTVVETGVLTAAQCAANTRILAVKYPRAFPATLRPRFSRLLAQIPAGTLFTAGTLSMAFLTVVPTDYSIAQQPRNYAVL